MDVVVVGNGMVADRFVAEMVDTAAFAQEAVSLTVIGEERHRAYDRVALSSLFDGREPADLLLRDPEFHTRHGVELVTGTEVVEIAPGDRTARTADGSTRSWDHLVLATGSRPFVPPIEAVGPGCFVYRTIEDLEAIGRFASRDDVKRGAVIGGGLLGLEAANALRLLGLETHVVECADRLMPAQLDQRGAATLQRHVEALGLTVHTSCSTTAVVPAGETVAALSFEGADPLEVDMVVLSAGIRPRDELAGAAGLELGPRGAVVVDDRLRTSHESISAIGECAVHRGRIYGLVAPGYAMARVAAAAVAAEALGEADDARFEGADLSTKLKLLGVDVAVVGAPDDDADTIVWDDPTAGTYSRLDLERGTGRVVGAMLVGDASAYPEILQRFRSSEATDDLRTGDISSLVAPAGSHLQPSGDPLICSCENVCRSTLSHAIEDGACSVVDLKTSTRAGTGCGGCVPELQALLHSSGEPLVICEHLPVSRAELYDLMRLSDLRTFRSVLAAVDAGVGDTTLPPDGCEKCKPVVASVLATLHNEHILDGDRAALQDTNDHFLANMQRDGTYSVIPRIPGGEITPEKLIAIGEVARDFSLHTKITGGQRIDMLGAEVDQLPAIWQRLIDAGMESGHAYGKALRTVKSCVGSRWCRYGVQDSTEMAIRLEQRYRGLRSPHKIKLAVSGCARECAEAQGKDVGVIATDSGWNLYVAGNGGKTPRHAKLLAEDLDDENLVRMIDRFLMYYVRTAEALERTATWMERLEGGLEQIRRVVIDDVLGLAEEFEADMDRHVATYECEWAATLADPARRSRFVSHVQIRDTEGSAGLEPVGLRERDAQVEDSSEWIAVCDIRDLVPGRGVAVALGERSVALFRVGYEVRAIDDRDPFADASVLSRGLLGSCRLDGEVVRYVASPLKKQRFDLDTGRCLDHPGAAVDTFAARCIDGGVQISCLPAVRPDAHSGITAA